MHRTVSATSAAQILSHSVTFQLDHSDKAYPQRILDQDERWENSHCRSRPSADQLCGAAKPSWWVRPKSMVAWQSVVIIHV